MRVPGSKSISNRALRCRAEPRRHGARRILESDDHREPLHAWAFNGARTAPPRHRLWRRLSRQARRAFLGASGLSMRTLLALGDGHYRVDGMFAYARSARSATWSTRFARSARIFATRCTTAAAVAQGRYRSRLARRLRGDVSSCLTGVLQALPLLHREVGVDVEGELISAPYVGITLDLMQRFGVTWSRIGSARARGTSACAAVRATRARGASTSRPTRFGVVFPGGGCAGGRYASKASVAQRAGRRCVCRRTRLDGRTDIPRRRLDRGARRHRPCGHRPRLRTDPGCRDDGGGGGAVRTCGTTLRNIGSCVKETDRIDAMARES